MSKSKIDKMLEVAGMKGHALLVQLYDSSTPHTEIALNFDVSEAAVRRWRVANGVELSKTPEIPAPRILVWDIESSPIIGYTWGMWEQSVIRVKQDWKLMSVAYKWLGEEETHVKQLNDFKGYKGGEENMDDAALTAFARDLLDQCDYAVAHNGDAFDVKKVMAKIVEHGLSAPSPFIKIDTLKIARRNFKMSSNKLDSLGEIFGLGRKINHSGFQMWLDCMAGNKQAWKEMGEYAKQDVVLLEQIFYTLLPWITNLQMNQFSDERVCDNCASNRLIETNGLFRTKTTVKPALQCLDCGSWVKA